MLPVYTHNCQWIPNGTRTTASNDEILERFLAGEKILGATEVEVNDALSQSIEQGDKPLNLTYSYYLFQSGNNQLPTRRLRDEAIHAALQKYRTMDLTQELTRFRLDYVYERGTAQPLPVTGYDFTERSRTPAGAIYSVRRIAAPAL